MEKNRWFFIALGGVIASIFALFLPIIIYSINGNIFYFNIVDFVGRNPNVDNVLAVGFQGQSALSIDAGCAAALGVITVVAVFCAVIGLVTLRSQRPNTVQFALTIAGLIGVMIPSAVAIAVVVGNGANYIGNISLGIAPILTPIAMAASIGAVFRRKNRVAEEKKQELIKRGLMRQGGNLD